MCWTYLGKGLWNPVLIMALMLWGEGGAAQSPAITDKQYKISSWTTDDGLPGNSCVKIVQDENGFLWMGSFDGLVRFDGTRFITYNKSNLLPSNYAVAMTADRQGNLWVGTDHGLIVYKEGAFIDLSDKEHGFFIESLFLDEDAQKIWIGVRNGNVFTYDIVTQTYQQLEGLNSKDIINDFLKGKDGSMWIAGEKNGLSQYKRGEWKHYTEQDGLLNREIKSLCESSTGALYVGTSSGLYKRKPDGKFEEVMKFRGMRVNKVIENKDGNLWVGTVNGLYVQSVENDWIYISRQEGLSNNDIREIFFDADGSVWLGTYRGGVNQMRETKFRWFFGGQGPDIEAVGALCQLDANTLLIGTTQGKLFTLSGNVIKDHPTKTIIDQRIYALLQDNKKNLWIASYNGLVLKTQDGRERLFTEKDGLGTNQIRAIYQDKKNNYWIGTRNAGLIKMNFDRYPDKPRFEQYRYSELSEVNSTFIMAINEDADGNLMVCTNNGGLTFLSPEGKLTNYTKSDGLGSNICFSVRKDNEGVTWVTTTDGLTRIKQGKLFTFTRNDGMPHENPMDVIEDDFGFLWLPTQKGTIRVSKRQLNEYAEGKIKSIEWKLFDKNNDLVKSECTGTAHSLKGADGKIWFPMIGGLMCVDPATIDISKNTPRILFESVTVDDQVKDITETILISAGSKRIAFEFIALTLQYPNSARYKYKLENFDNDWIDGGFSRQATYTSLPRGHYSFKVIACNNDGVWSESGPAVSIIVLPHLYQTWWFFSFVILVILFTGYTYTRIRTKSIKQRSAELELLVTQRTKLIAEQRDELFTLNEELRLSEEQVMMQRDALAEKIKELAEKNQEIERMNENLERIVEERTNVLEVQNKRLAKYAFINAHKLRAPLASILGIVNLFSLETVTEEQTVMSKHLLKAAQALDKVVQSINRLLEREFGSGPDEEPENSDEETTD